tara:strand:+ start:3149 stop:3955 length:807 start_codon:yes stop_codon:yes gene_type:complete
MDLSQLSKETMELSEQIGSKQMQLLFDENYFCDEISLEDPIKSEAQIIVEEKVDSAGVAFFIDKSSGSFCLRGAAFSSSKVLSDREVLEAENHRFHRADSIHWFTCDSFSQAQIIVDQMMNRRFPFEDEAICNISDPGASWWLHKTNDSLKIFFKSMGRKGEFEKIGPLGDSEIAKYRWKKASNFFSNIDESISLECEENCIAVNLNKIDKKGRTLACFEELLKRGENNFKSNSFNDSLEHKTLFLYLTELAAIRKFWILVEQKLLTD